MVLECRRILDILFNIDRALLLIEERLLGDIHRLDLLLYDDPVLDTVPNLILDLVLDAGEGVLHIHDCVVQRKTLTKSRVGLLPNLDGIFLVLLLLCFRQILQRVRVQLLVHLEEVFLRLFKILAFKITSVVLHLLNWVASCCK